MRIQPLLAAAILATSLIAHADTLSTFDLNATTVSGGSASGTVTLDATIGLFTSADITVLTQGGQFLFNGVPLASPGYGTVWKDTLNNQFILSLPVSSLIGYTGGELCSVLLHCGNSMVSFPSLFFANMTGPFNSDFVEAGTLTLASTAPTPEPSSIALLATGLLGVVHLTRRRLLGVRPPLHLLRISPDEDLVIDPLAPAPTETPEPPQHGLFDGL